MRKRRLEAQYQVRLCRGCLRRGPDQLRGKDVKTDKQRDYLGNSLMASVGRWQKRRDLILYVKDPVGFVGKSRKEQELALTVEVCKREGSDS